MSLPTLKGSLITLRQLRKSDASSLQRHANDRQVARNLLLLPHPYTIENALVWIRFTHSLVRKGRSYPFGIEDNQSGEIVGMIDLVAINDFHKIAELGYWLGRRYWRRGYTSEAVQLILRFGFRQLRLRRIYAHTFDRNQASYALLKKAGFIYEGTERKSRRKGNRWLDLHLLSILREEFKIRKPK
ncbi:MAG: GNAT family N-acetyltransferase [candidate division Zixibacteria bacterium]|nr:GNAT family N-acetyltransferase [candidate division Zixibacteria bacterium]